MIQLALIFLFALNANAEVTTSGKLFMDAYAPYRNPGTTRMRQFNQSAWINIDSKVNDSVSGHVEITADHFEQSLSSSDTTTTFGLREGFATYTKNGFDLKAGKMILPWGKADGFNPTDYLSAKDYTFLNPEEEYRRLGAIAAQFAYTPNQGSSPFTYTLVIQPVGPRAKLLVPTSAVPAGVTVGSTVHPEKNFSNAELAAKIAYTKSNWDLSISGFRGMNHTPEYFLSATGGTILAPTFTISPTHNRVSAVGADFSSAFSEWILRSEAAYWMTQNNDGSNPTKQPSHLDVVVGIEKPFFKDFRLIAQVMGKYHPKYKSPDETTGSNAVDTAIQQGIARTNALLLNYQEKWRPSASARFGYDDPSLSWTAEIFCMVNFHGGDSLIRPKASYLWSDAFRTTLGVDRYAGSDGRPLGAIRSYNSAFAEAKYTF